MAEQASHNRPVAGSNPAPATTARDHLPRAKTTYETIRTFVAVASLVIQLIVLAKLFGVI